MEIIKPEVRKSPRERLLELEASGKYVFHGAPVRLNFLEPRQAYGYDPESKEETADGEPVVFGTAKVDAAIFHSLVRRECVQGDSDLNWGTNEGGDWVFFATKNLIDAAKDNVGYVYVFDKNDFDESEAIQVRAKEEVTPVEIIKVKYNDLPKNIRVLD